MKNTSFTRGFTLLELMSVLAIMGILIAIAAPGYRNIMAREKVRTALNEWQSSFYFAQSEALRLKEGVIFCSSVDGKMCSKNNDFGVGWIVFYQDPDNNNKNTILQDVAIQDNDMSIMLKPPVLQGTLRFYGDGRLRINAGGSVDILKKGVTDSNMTLNISSAGRLSNST